MPLPIISALNTTVNECHHSPRSVDTLNDIPNNLPESRPSHYLKVLLRKRLRANILKP